jgi:predicted porin
MKLSYSTIAAVLLSTLSVSSFAGDVAIYGKANLTAQSSDDDKGSFTEIKSNASRIGFKGGQDLGDDLEVIFKAEFQVDLAGDSDDSFTDRNQYIGLKGNFGSVLLGKNDTVLKQSQGKVDLFSDLNGDIKKLWVGENRLSDTLTYKSAKFNGLQLGVTYVAEDEVDGNDASSIALFYGDKSLKKSKIFASIALDSDIKGQSKDKSVAKQYYDTVRATVQGKLSGFTLGAIYHSQEGEDGSEMNGLLVSAKYGFDKVTVKAQLQTAEHDGGDDRSSMTLGADYKLAKSTKLFAFYTTFDMDSEEDKDYLAVGIEYKF